MIYLPNKTGGLLIAVAIAALYQVVVSNTAAILLVAGLLAAAISYPWAIAQVKKRKASGNIRTMGNVSADDLKKEWVAALQEASIARREMSNAITQGAERQRVIDDQNKIIIEKDREILALKEEIFQMDAIQSKTFGEINPEGNPHITQALKRRTLLMRQTDQLLNMDDLRELALSTGFDFGNLGGTSKRAKIISLLTQAENVDRLQAVINQLEYMRPNANWRFK